MSHDRCAWIHETVTSQIAVVTFHCIPPAAFTAAVLTTFLVAWRAFDMQFIEMMKGFSLICMLDLRHDLLRHDLLIHGSDPNYARSDQGFLIEAATYKRVT
jgi:hypothetical protein